MEGEQGIRLTVCAHEYIPQKLYLSNNILKVHSYHNYWSGYEENMLEERKTKGQLWDPGGKLSRRIAMF